MYPFRTHLLEPIHGSLNSLTFLFLPKTTAVSCSFFVDTHPHFISGCLVRNLWRAGRLGKVCLDYVPNPGEVERLRQLRAQTEPPGPWGPACYPEALSPFFLVVANGQR